MTIKVGSDAHKVLFCRQFVETHERYDPTALPWPDLDAAQLDRLRSVPFWQEVYHTERRAGAIVAAFTPMVQDPLVREAVALQGVEGARHAELLRVMIDRYGLDATEQPLEAFPPNLETAFIDCRLVTFCWSYSGSATQLVDHCWSLQVRVENRSGGSRNQQRSPGRGAALDSRRVTCD